MSITMDKEQFRKMYICVSDDLEILKDLPELGLANMSISARPQSAV